MEHARSIRRLRVPRGSLVLLASAALGCDCVASAATLRVFAASSLTDAFREVASAYEKANPGHVVELNFAGSQVLRTQIEQGAQADVFASADLEQAEALRRSGELHAFRVFARSRIVVVVPAGSTLIKSLEDLTRPGIKVAAAGPSVPAGRYTEQALGKLGTQKQLGADFPSHVRANVVSYESNVRAVLSKVMLGEADAGFVYATDAATSSKVRTIELPDGCNATAEYPIAVVSRSRLPTQARGFVDFVFGAQAAAVLRKFGFAR